MDVECEGGKKGERKDEKANCRKQRRRGKNFYVRISFPFRGSIMDIFNAAQHARLLSLPFLLLLLALLRFIVLEKLENRKISDVSLVKKIVIWFSFFPISCIQRSGQKKGEGERRRFEEENFGI
jgi:hypothetical protein